MTSLKERLERKETTEKTTKIGLLSTLSLIKKKKKNEVKPALSSCFISNPEHREELLLACWKAHE
jgi:hypothetical protein